MGQITSLNFGSRILANWITLLNGLLTSGWPTYSSTLGPTYSRSVYHSAEQRGRGILFSPPRLSGLARQSLQADLSKGLLYMYSPVSLLPLLFTW